MVCPAIFETITWDPHTILNHAMPDWRVVTGFKRSSAHVGHKSSHFTWKQSAFCMFEPSALLLFYVKNISCSNSNVWTFLRNKRDLLFERVYLHYYAIILSYQVYITPDKYSARSKKNNFLQQTKKARLTLLLVSLWLVSIDHQHEIPPTLVGTF